MAVRGARARGCRRGGASRAQTGALALLAAFVQHGDNSANNQRFVCPGSALRKEGDRHHEPLMYISDLGRPPVVNIWDQSTIGRANYKEWSQVPMWDDPATCRAKLGAKFREPTLMDPVVTEAGRRFLADLLVQLTDRQIRDMFQAGRMDQRGWPDPAGRGTDPDHLRMGRCLQEATRRHRQPPLPVAVLQQGGAASRPPRPPRSRRE